MALYTCLLRAAAGFTRTRLRAFQSVARSSWSAWRAAVRAAYRRSWARRLTVPSGQSCCPVPHATPTQRLRALVHSILTIHHPYHRGARATRRRPALAPPCRPRAEDASETAAPHLRHHRSPQAPRRRLSAPSALAGKTSRPLAPRQRTTAGPRSRSCTPVWAAADAAHFPSDAASLLVVATMARLAPAPAPRARPASAAPARPRRRACDSATRRRHQDVAREIPRLIYRC